MVVDLQYGSTGKGLLCGYLGDKGGYDTVISANMPNAGHTYINSSGKKWVYKVLPSSSVGADVKTIMIGPGSVFSIRRLEEEIVNLRPDQRLVIHPNAVVLSEDHAIEERKRLNHISSTTQGSAAAVIDKMWRRQDHDVIARDVLRNTRWRGFVASHREWQIRLEQADAILAEGSQGYSLGINTQFYPFTTSRDCTPAAFLSAMGIPWYMLRHVFGSARTLPIRVGGPSGDYYPDQHELSWQELGFTPERTTVTNKIRRIFTFSEMQIREALFYCGPDYVFLNFANYLTQDLVMRMVEMIDVYSEVRWMGHGPTFLDVQEFEL